MIQNFYNFLDCYCNNFYQEKSVLEAIIVPQGQIVKFKKLLKDAGCKYSANYRY